jgi:uncharacterized spore protein YtfJ
MSDVRMHDPVNRSTTALTQEASLGAVQMVRDTLARFLESGHVGRVYGTPTEKGDITVIPAAETLTLLGFGAGYGSGSSTEGSGAEPAAGGGGGGGGGGRTLSRPVAVVVASPTGVRVEPVVDATKVGLAAITAAGLMMTILLGILGPKDIARRLRGDSAG